MKHRLLCKIDIEHSDGQISRASWNAPVRILLSSGSLNNIRSLPDIRNLVVSDMLGREDAETIPAPPCGSHTLHRICNFVGSRDLQETSSQHSASSLGGTRQSWFGCTCTHALRPRTTVLSLGCRLSTMASSEHKLLLRARVSPAQF